MRGIAYVVAAIAAVGIMIGIARLPEPPAADDASTETSPVAVNSQVMLAAGTLTLNVPEMHCEFACYPKVKESLKKSDGVREVELAEQGEEGVIDNRQVIVKYDPGFDLTKAIAQLSQAGFADSELVQ
jgi:mercuric ion binding protein